MFASKGKSSSLNACGWLNPQAMANERRATETLDLVQDPLSIPSASRRAEKTVVNRLVGRFSLARVFLAELIISCAVRRSCCWKYIQD